MSIATFKVEGIHLDGAREATVTVDREGHQLVEVRPKGRRRTYVLPLSEVAVMVAHVVAKRDANAAGIRVPVARKGRARI